MIPMLMRPMATSHAQLLVRRDAIERLSARTADAGSELCIQTPFGNAIGGWTASLNSAIDS